MNWLCPLNFHDWTEWKLYQHTTYYTSGKVMFTDLRKRRECQRCKDVQDYAVGYTTDLPLEINEEHEQ